MRTRPDYGEWELHKAQIEQIYLHENKTQKELSMIMEETHEFRKTYHSALAAIHQMIANSK
jgi:hypothetical protein